MSDESKEDMEVGNLTYQGNSVSYIHTKMKCYGDQVEIYSDALCRLGFADGYGNNSEMRVALETWVENFPSPPTARIDMSVGERFANYVDEIESLEETDQRRLLSALEAWFAQ